MVEPSDLGSSLIFMVSGWWLLLAFWMGGCLGTVLSTLLYLARYGHDRENQIRSGAREVPFGGGEATPDV